MNYYLFVIPVLLVILFYALFYFFKNWKKNSVQRDFSVIEIMTVSLFLLYFDYLLGDKAFSFHGDSFQQTYPNLVSRASQIANGIWKEYVNFRQGLGNRESALVLTPANWFCIFGEDNVLKWMGINHYLKVLTAGILAYFWAKTYSGSSETGFIIAFGYAASSEFTVRCAWESYPNTALLLVFWLLTYEYWHRKGEWRLLPFATVLFFYGTGIYNCLVWGFLLAFYILFRELEDTKGKVEWKRWMQTELVYILFAVLGMTDTLIAQLQATFSSTRFTDVSSGLSFLDYGIFADLQVIFTAMLRTLGQSIMGVGNYRGYYNFLEGPAFYCGILLVLLIPVAIYNLEGKKRVCYILAVLAACMYILVTPIRVIANGFRDATFKLSAYWICIFMFILSMEVLTLIFSDKKLKKGSVEIFQVTAVTVVISFWAASKLQYIANIDALICSVLFVLVYTIIMMRIGQGDQGKKLFLGSLCLIFAAETIVLSRPVINNRGAIGIHDMQENKVYYNDYTVDAVKYLNEKDKGWYRLGKSYHSVLSCDSLVQNYYGLESYIGGTEADQGIIAIYQALGLTRADEDYHDLRGTGGNIYASALLSEKYYLSKDKTVDRYGLRYLTGVEDVSVYENKLALPIAYTYDQTIREDEFEQLSLYDRSRNILNACVVNTQSAAVPSIDPSIFRFSDLSGHELSFEKSDETTYSVILDRNNILVVRMMMAGEGHGQPVEVIDENGSTVSCERISYSEGERVLEIYCDNVQSVRFSDIMCGDIESIEFFAVDAEQYYAELERNVAKLQDHAMKITAHDDIYNHIEGTVDCEQPRVLATSIPVSDDWKISVDGQAVEGITVNGGLLGCYLDGGKHDIVIFYDGKGQLEANMFKMIGFIASLGILATGIYNKNHMWRNNKDGKHISSGTGLQ